MRTWIPLGQSYAYGPESTLGDALRSWIALNQSNEHEAATFLQNNGLLGALANIHRWLGNEPSGELYTARMSRFVELTGIDLDRLMVVEAKREAVRRFPDLAGRVRFETDVTRQQCVEMAGFWADAYSGNGRCVTRQIGVADQRLSEWRRGAFLPSGEDLVLLVTALTRGLYDADCQEDCFLSFVAERMFQTTREDLFGLATFRAMLGFLFETLGDRKSTTAKEDVFGLKQPTVDRMRKWTPGQNKLPMESVLGIVRAFLRYHRPDLLAGFDAMRPEFEESWTVTREHRQRRTEGGEPPVGGTDAEPTERAEAPPTAEAPAMPEPIGTPDEEPTVEPAPTLPAPAESDELLVLLRSIREAAPHLRAFLDAFAPPKVTPAAVVERPVEPAPPTSADEVSPWSTPIGETLDGLEHCLGETGFPDFSETPISDDTRERIERAFAQFRMLLLAIGGLNPQVRGSLGLRPDLEETVLLVFGLLKYENTGAALRIIQSNLEMARRERVGKRK